jgi:hypothetical protein
MARLLPYMTHPEAWKRWKKLPVIKQDWVPTGRIDFATRLYGNPEASDQPSEFKLLVEERRIVESITGNENLEIRWRLATLNEAKVVVSQFHKYLSENSLIKIPEATDHQIHLEIHKIGLSDNQLEIIMRTAGPLSEEKRQEFLQRVAAILPVHAQINDDDVSVAVHRALSDIIRDSAVWKEWNQNSPATIQDGQVFNAA